MTVSTALPFQLVYSLFAHEYLGHLFTAHVVQLGPGGRLTLQHQTVSARNAPEFAAGLLPDDYELIALCDQLQQEAVLKEFWPRKISAADFFLKTYNPEKGDKPLQEAIARYVQNRLGRLLAGLAGKQVFVMGRDGEPTWRALALAPAAASVLFHFRRGDEGTPISRPFSTSNNDLISSLKTPCSCASSRLGCWSRTCSTIFGTTWTGASCCRF